MKNETQSNKAQRYDYFLCIGTSKMGSNIYRGARARSSIFAQNPWHVHFG